MRRLWAMAALLLAATGGACGDGGGMMMPADQSLLVVEATFNESAYEIHQFKLQIHAGVIPASVTVHDQMLSFPMMVSSTPLPSGSTMGVILPIALTGMLDLNMQGLNGSQVQIAAGSKQAVINPGGTSNVTILLGPPPP
jgi:hypothetical protein